MNLRRRFDVEDGAATKDELDEKIFLLISSFYHTY